MGATHLVDGRGGDEHHPRFRVDSADVRRHLSQVCLVFLEGHLGAAGGWGVGGLGGWGGGLLFVSPGAHFLGAISGRRPWEVIGGGPYKMAPNTEQRRVCLPRVLNRGKDWTRNQELREPLIFVLWLQLLAFEVGRNVGMVLIGWNTRRQAYQVQR